MLLIGDHQIEDKTFMPEIGMRLQQLAHQTLAIGTLNLHQQDWMIARDRLRPQIRLPTPISLQNGRFSAQTGVRVQNTPCQLVKQRRILIVDIELM